MQLWKQGFLPVSLLVLMVTTGQAKADFQIKATLDSEPNTISPAASVTINLGDGKTPTISYTPGVVNWKGVSTNNAPFNGPFSTFCIQLNQDIYLNKQYTYTVTSDLADAPVPGGGMGKTAANEIEQLWGQFYSQISNPTNNNTAGENAAAFQLAIWKIESDWGGSNETSFSAGNFQATADATTDPTGSAAISTASGWLTLLSQNTYTADTNLVALESMSAQDQITALPVPIPPSFALAGIGALCLFGYAYLQQRVPALKLAEPPVQAEA